MTYEDDDLTHLFGSNSGILVDAIDKNSDAHLNIDLDLGILPRLLFFWAAPKRQFGLSSHSLKSLLANLDELYSSFFVIKVFIKVGLGIYRANADSQWNPVYNAFHRNFG